MIVVGLVTHDKPPVTAPQLDGVASVAVTVNGRSLPEPTPWRGFGANHNQLMDIHAHAEWYVVLNPDVGLSAEQLTLLIEHADSNGYALAGPVRREPWGLRGGSGEPLPTPGYFLTNTFRIPRAEQFSQSLPRSSGPMVDSAWVAGSCMAIRGDLMREIRFDERYFMYFEDTDLCQRACKLGARVGVCTSVIVDHASGWKRDDPLIARRGVEYARSALEYAKAYRHPPQLMRTAALTWLLPRTVVPGRSAAGLACNRAFAKGLLFPSRPGLMELAAGHNDRYGLHQ